MIIECDGKDYKYDNLVSIVGKNKIYLGDKLLKHYKGRSKAYCKDIIKEIAQSLILEISLEKPLSYVMPKD